MITLLRNFIYMLLVLGLGLSARASSSPLGDVSVALGSSNSVGEFIERVAKSRAIKLELNRYAREKGVKQLPKARFENQILTLIAPDNSILKIEIVNGKSRELKFNGQRLVLNWQDTVYTIASKIENILTHKSSFWHELVFPEANAVVPLAYMLIFGGMASAVAVVNYFDVDCDDLAANFREHIKQTNIKNSTGIEVKKVVSCEDTSVKLEVTDRQDDNKTTNIALKLPDLLRGDDDHIQTGEIVQEGNGPSSAQKIVYGFTRGRSNLNLQFSGVSIDGVAVKDPTLLKMYKKKFEAYSQLSAPLIRKLGKKCVECVPGLLSFDFTSPPSPGVHKTKSSTH